MLSGALIKTSLVDYPGKVACAWFLTMCDLRCPYCYSGELVFNRLPPEDSYTEERVFEHLKRRRNVLSGFVISGGEALMRPELPELIRKAKALGYQVKLDTNGMHPDALEKLFSDDATTPDFIAVDGNKFVPYQKVPYACVVKGDGKIQTIAAASILAKTYRDAYMEDLAQQFPEYHWQQNKGYPTPERRKAIAEHGATEHHRKTFQLLPVEQLSLF